MPLELRRERDNVHDRNAIAVYFGALQIGFIKAGIATHLAPAIDSGIRYNARVESLTGGGQDGRSRGVNIYVWRETQASRDEHRLQLEQARAQWNGDGADVVRALIGDREPHDAQREVLARIDAGKNVLAVLGTGRGKSFCFQYPAALRALAGGAKTLVLYPLRALANDQFDALTRKFESFGLRIYRANGSITTEERAELFAALERGAWDIVLATPEFLAFHSAQFSGPSTPQFVVVDEAHHLYEATHRAAYAALGENIARLGRPQILALTATAGDDAFKHVVAQLGIDAWVIDPTVRTNLRMIDARGRKDKLGYLVDTFTGGGKAIVYCNSRSEAGKVAEALRKHFGDEVMYYHAGVPTPQRTETETRFRDGRLRIIVATSAFGEGIDLPDVRDVVLYHLNFDFTEFNQQAGRAGRDGQAAEIHLLFGEADRRINDYIIDREAPTLPLLRVLYREIKKLGRDGIVRMTYTDMARTLEIDKADDRTISRALHIFAEEGLVEIAEDDDGRYVRFLPPSGKVDLTQNERFAEGEAERELFDKFADLVLTAKPDALERIINRPIYPQRVDLLR